MIFGTGSNVSGDFYNKLFRKVTQCRLFRKSVFKSEGFWRLGGEGGDGGGAGGTDVKKRRLGGGRSDDARFPPPKHQPQAGFAFLHASASWAGGSFLKTVL